MTVVKSPVPFRRKGGQYGPEYPAFEKALQAIKKNPKQDELYHHSITLALTAAKALMEETDVQPVIDRFISELEERTGTPIRKETDPNLPTAATIQYAKSITEIIIW